MDILILIVIFFALVHFIYESILAPNIRLYLRHQLFVLRDTVHDMKMEENISKNNEKAISNLEQNINTALDRMNSLNIYNIYTINKHYHHNQKLKLKLEKAQDILNNVTDNRIKEIKKSLNMISGKVLVINSGGWLIYIIPIALLVFLLKTVGNKVTSLIQELLLMPSYEFERFDKNNKIRMV